MIQLKKLTFNAFQVNTYILFDETGECVIIDAANSNEEEDNRLFQYIDDNKLKPSKLLSTHAHVDHILGNAIVSKRYNVKLGAHAGGELYLDNAIASASSFGMRLTEVLHPEINLIDNQTLTFGNSSLKVFHTPGHATGSACFYNKEASFVITGDVLFYQSIGRTDLPGGDYNLLKNSIWGKLFVLPDSTKVHPGHGPDTSIGSEKTDNPFIAIG